MREFQPYSIQCADTNPHEFHVFHFGAYGDPNFSELFCPGIPEEAKEPEEDRVVVRSSEMVPGRWWRVLGPDGSLWCETSDKDEARESMRPRDVLQRQYVVPDVREWREA